MCKYIYIYTYHERTHIYIYMHIVVYTLDGLMKEYALNHIGILNLVREYSFIKKLLQALGM